MNQFDKSYKNLIFRLLFVQGIVLILFLFGSILVSSKVKEEIANATAITLRSYLLEGDFRSAVTSAELGAQDKFSKIIFNDSRSSQKFVLTSNDLNSKTNSFFEKLLIKITINIYYGSDQTSSLGNIVFYYSIFDYVPWAVLIWLIGIVLSYPILSHGKQKIKIEIELRKDAALTDAARKLGHDIWAPVGVIEKLLWMMPDLNTVKKNQLDNAFYRLKSVVSDFMNDNKKILSTNDINFESAINESNQQQINTNVQDVSEVVEEIIQEKNLFIQNRPGIQILFEKPKTKIGLNVSRSEFSRMLSNILQNSIEAIDKSGSIFLKLEQENDKVFLSLKDTGRGIDSKYISRIGEKGFSLDKENGNGLGLYFVKKTVESWAGNFNFFSKKGEGTKIEILIPSQS